MGNESAAMMGVAGAQQAIGTSLNEMAKAVDDFAISITMFKDTVIRDLDNSVQIYKKSRALLEKRKQTDPDDLEAIKKLQIAHDKNKETVDVKLAFLNEKRTSDLRMMTDILRLAMMTFVEEGKRISKISTK